MERPPRGAGVDPEGGRGPAPARVGHPGAPTAPGPSRRVDSAGASAPGKVMIGGEYAVLDGHPAVLVAVDRRAVARIGDAEVTAPSPFVAAVADALATDLGAAHPAARAARRVVVDSSALADGGRKLGLGSSAAVTVAATAAALGAAGGALDRVLLSRLAHRAHGDAQAKMAGGFRGSGADVAASVHGGAIEFRASPPRTEVLSIGAGARLAFVWTEAVADTRRLVAEVDELRRRDGAAHAACVATIAAAATALAAALRADDAAGVVTAVDAGAAALGELARRSGAPLVLPAHDRVAALARSCGGAGKPTGAGGGDIALAAFADDAGAERFRRRAADDGLAVLDLAPATEGARLESAAARPTPGG